MGLGFWVLGLGFRVWGLGFGVWGFGFRVWGFGFIGFFGHPRLLKKGAFSDLNKRNHLGVSVLDWKMGLRLRA